MKERDGRLDILQGMAFNAMCDQYSAVTTGELHNQPAEKITDADALLFIMNASRAFVDDFCQHGFNGASTVGYQQLYTAAADHMLRLLADKGTISPDDTERLRLTVERSDDGSLSVSFNSQNPPHAFPIMTLVEDMPKPPTLISRTPKNHYIPNTKLAKEITQDIVGQGTIELLVSPPKAKKEIVTTCNLTYEGENIQLKSRYPYGEYDQAVYNAVVSLFVEGDPSHTMTPEMIYRAMNGLRNTEHPSNEQLAKVTASIDKMRFTRAVIDCTEELKGRRAIIDGEQINGGKVDTYLLNASTVTVTAGKATKTAYKIERPPVLYEHALISSQIMSCPAYLLDTRAVGSNNDCLIAIRNYLLRCILEMRSGHRDKHSIVFASYDKDGKHHQGIYERAGKAEPAKAEAKRIRDMTFAILDLYSGKTKGLNGKPLIKGYTATKKGHAIHGVQIDL